MFFSLLSFKGVFNSVHASVLEADDNFHFDKTRFFGLTLDKRYTEIHKRLIICVNKKVISGWGAPV